MRKVFLSFLGTNDYLPCNYRIAGHDPVANVRFVGIFTADLQPYIAKRHTVFIADNKDRGGVAA